MKIWICLVCGWVYDEAKGDEKEGFASGTLWADIPDDWVCPECGIGKEDFDMVEVKTAAPSATSSSEFLDRDPIIIIGSGMAAYNLAKEIRKIDQTMRLLMICADEGSFYIKPNLSNGLAHGKDPDDIILSSKKQVEAALNLSIKSYHKVTSINVKRAEIEAEGEIFKYSKLVLALGASPIMPKFAGNAGSRVHHVNNLLDYRKYRADLAGKSDVIIIGAGLIGCEFAADLSCQNKNVTLIDMACLPMSGLLPSQAGELMKERLIKENISLHLERHAQSIDMSEGKFAVKLDNGEVLTADLIVCAIGLRSNVTLAKNAGLEISAGIKVDQYLETSAKDIFAVGDCADIEGHVLMYVEPLMRSAKALARTLTGTPTKLSLSVMPVVVKTPLCPTIVASAPKDMAGEWELSKKGDTLEALYRNDAGEIIGFVLMGDAVSQKKELESTLPLLF